MAGKPTGGWVMGTPVAQPTGQPSMYNTATGVPVGNPHAAPNPYVIGPQETHYTGSTSASTGGAAPNNPYVLVSTQPGSDNSSPMGTVLKALGKCGKKLEDTTKKASGVTANVWQHLKTSPSLTDAAMSKLALGTKVFAEGGCDKLFHQAFGTLPGEQLKKTYACYLSTSSGPVIGTLYLSNARIAFCSDNPVSLGTSPNAQQQVMYYKVVVPLDRLRAVNPSANAINPSDKYIQVVTADNHEFWFMGFVNFDKALRNLTEALPFSNPFHAQLPMS
ncbi:GRAM domain-containing protein / ABA-responsive protein-like protein [Rhynchospora pubera]|uniref:GRAM domain-containing protein / ABA-responsive protein-like protein n=1 Tax=Rhynchospora pubera TaxID=906938 RepID=A0AAV8CJ34_9POAL|nr:GRAM domain-containing protein / ABA-responsive protein-like protein [Rhynchospora pubera]KAJ4791790.1 GRAM domain-containing protein / ABA-responsive protein-like protein [Rhynchospora pubera]